MSLGTLSLIDIAQAVVDQEAQEWGDEPAMSLFLDDSIEMVRIETELMAAACALRTGERPRIFSICGAWSVAARMAGHYEMIARNADVWIFGVADEEVSIPGVVLVPIPRGAVFTQELGVVVDAPSFGAALFAIQAGQLESSERAAHYYEGFLTTRQEAVEAAAGRLAAVLKLAPLAQHWVDHDLVSSWYTRLNRRLLETLESQKLQHRSREIEMKQVRDESQRLEKMVRGYLGGQTWDEVRQAVHENREAIADNDRVELTICFCDLVGFSKLSERLDPAEVAQLLNDHFKRLYNIVRQHGGTVDKFIGDAMLATFAYPVEGFEAGKKMVQESRSVRIKEGFTVPVQVRVGLNTGYVAHANLGVPEMRQFTVVGEAVNYAQRMQSAASPHSVLISERTFAYCRSRSFGPWNRCKWKSRAGAKP